MALPRSKRRILAASTVVVLMGFLAAVVIVSRRQHGVPASSPPSMSISASASDPIPVWSASAPTLPADVTVSWTWLDSTEGDILHGGDTIVRPLDALIVPALAEDYVGGLNAAGETVSPHAVAVLHGAFTGHSDQAGQLADLASPTGGAATVMARVADECQVPALAASPPAGTTLDIAHYAACLRESVIADPDAVQWVLNQMRETSGGIGDERGNDGGARLAQFNSTTDAGNGRKRTTCMGIGAYWSAAVQVEWPSSRGDMFGVAACAQVARGQFPPDTQRAPDSPAPASQPSLSPVAPASMCPYDTCRGTD